MIQNLEAGLDDDAPARVFLYFSSESHLHSLRNTILLSGTMIVNFRTNGEVSVLAVVHEPLGLPENRTVATALEAMDLQYLSHGNCALIIAVPRSTELLYCTTC